MNVGRNSRNCGRSDVFAARRARNRERRMTRRAAATRLPETLNRLTSERPMTLDYRQMGVARRRRRASRTRCAPRALVIVPRATTMLAS